MDAPQTPRFSSKADHIQTALDKHRARLHILQQAKFHNEDFELGLLFDHHWYAAQYLPKELSFGRALAHFLTEGLKQCWNPSPFFSTLYYAGQTEFAEWPLNILLHYIREGAARGLNPCPLFDSPWYYEKYKVASSGLTPLAHFIQAARQGMMHDPNNFFDAALYLEEQDLHGEYPHPLFHYLEKTGNLTIRPSKRFSTDGYLLTYEDVSKSGMNPLEHYLRCGQFEGRNPRALSIDYDEDTLRLEEFTRTPKDKRLVFYTAIAGDYSRLLPAAALLPGARYVCFTDLPRQTYGMWTIRPLPETFEESARWASRWCKLHPHELFPDAEVAVWLDGNIVINGDMTPYIQRVLESGLPVGMIRHPLRDCVYEEVTACIARNKDSEERLLRQKERYLSLALPAHGGLYETNAVINNLGHPALPAFYDAWWQELSTQSFRDQVSLPYVLHKLKLTPCEFLPEGTSARNSNDFIFLSHDNTFHIRVKENVFPAAVQFPERSITFAEYRRQHPDCLDAVRDRRADVIVAVHNALNHVKACFASLLPTLREADGLIIVNDLSDAETSGWLREFAQSDSRIRLIENERNLGYTGSANRGLRASDAPFRVMLNSDTLVPANWLEKMLLVAYGDEKTGIVGPLSNAASHQSMPLLEYTADNTPINALPKRKTVTDMDLFCEGAAPYGLYPSVPLAHGFCLGIRQEVIDRIGFFDEIHFARFFGEENDYCMRAVEAGFILRVATPVYVFHAKSKSIAEEIRRASVGEAGNTLRRMYGRKKIETAIFKVLHNPFLLSMRNTCANFYRLCEATLSREPSQA
jgi:GT2 family glycosyltransferase